MKLRSPFKDDHYYQDILMNVPHRHVDELRHEKYDDLPLAIRHFAAAVTLRPELWTNETAVRDHFSLMGNRNDYVDTLIANSNAYKYSFFPRVIPLWSSLPRDAVCAESIRCFQAKLNPM